MSVDVIYIGRMSLSDEHMSYGATGWLKEVAP